MSMIIRGTTPTLTFNVKNEQMDLAEIAEVWITFKSKAGVRLVEKTYDINDVTIDATEKTITLSLSQEDTLEFVNAPNGEMLVQVRLRMNDDMAFASAIIETSIGQILKDGVI